MAQHSNVLYVLPLVIAAIAGLLGSFGFPTGMTLTLVLSLMFLGPANEAAILLWGGSGTDHLALIIISAVGAFLFTFTWRLFLEWVVWSAGAYCVILIISVANSNSFAVLFDAWYLKIFIPASFLLGLTGMLRRRYNLKKQTTA